jgi:hypothetical protein
LIAMDTASGTKDFTLTLWTHHPERFVIAEDRDFEQLVDLDAPPFTYIVAEQAGVRTSRLKKCLDNPPRGKQWVKVTDFDLSSTLYHLEFATTSDVPGTPTP